MTAQPTQPKTSSYQARATKNYRDRMIKKGFVWKSVFIPKEKEAEFADMVSDWRKQYG